jgi:predicted ATPase with chaperone activity
MGNTSSPGHIPRDPSANDAGGAAYFPTKPLNVAADRALDGDDLWWAIAASQPGTNVAAGASAGEAGPADATAASPASFSALVGKLTSARELLREPDGRPDDDSIVQAEAAAAAAPPPAVPPATPAHGADHAHGARREEFVPLEPTSWRATGLSDREVESLVVKYLLNTGTSTGRKIADQIRLPFGLTHELLSRLKAERLVVYKGSAPLNDYAYELTDLGCDRARRYILQCTYFGAAPVSLADYVASVAAQSVADRKPNLGDICRAFADLVLNRGLLVQLGQAMHSGRGLFLHGAPGNGKTSIAERVTRALGESIWIPRAISVFGEIIRFYDPSSHEAIPSPGRPAPIGGRHVDERWIRIRRPTIVVGGELTMANLEVTINNATGINEAPLQLKSNCGTLVIDDFGRQRISTAELLNRWIVPLEKRYDFLNLASGRKIQVPFDQLIVFSTNLEPSQLVDEAFLRRIPYKICVEDPSESEFRELFRRTADKMNIVYHDDIVEYVLEKHYRARNRPMRFCHPRDLLYQVSNACSLYGQRPEMTREHIDVAIQNYFSVL